MSETANTTPLPWGIHTLARIYPSKNSIAGLPSGRVVRAVCVPYDSPRSRVVAAWWVLTGRAFALWWPKPGELEDLEAKDE